MVVIRLLACLCGLGLLVGCDTGPTIREELARIQGLENLYSDYPRAGYTYLSFNRLHGFQVEYFGNDQSKYLWYPGNRKVLPGAWKVEGKKVCYLYGTSTYNPVTQSSGARWQCTLRDTAGKGVVSSIKGDAFKLSSSESVPYVLQKCKAPKEFKLRRAATC